jgi:N-acetylneuraminic acid mutarotase
MIKSLRFRKSILVCVLFFCFYGGYAQDWTWIKGGNTINNTGVYGLLNVPAASNLPGARSNAAMWTDNSGNLWLFGGEGFSSSTNGRLNDLWKFDPSTQNWTWVKGPDAINQNGVYGVLGVSSIFNNPGSRIAPVTWVDASGNLWMFGGYGNDIFGNVDNLNDLWKYNIASGQWTWVGGSNTVNQYGSYGTLATASTTNIPGARRLSTGWKDNSGNFWLFGGFGLAEASGPDGLNDLWKYDPVGNTWTWVKGSKVTNQFGTYGVLATASSSNTPGTRYGAKSWKDNSGNLWLFSGYGNASSALGYLNDIWKFNTSTSQWTWMRGSNLINATSLIGTQSIPSLTNTPGGRHLSSIWSDANDNIYIQGGSGISLGGAQQLNDFWKYSCTTNQWTYIRGSLYEVAGNYGTQSVTASASDPGSGYSRMSWKDNSGNFWLFGGSGYDVNSNFNFLNELWKMNPCLPGAPINLSQFSGQNACTGSSATLSAISNTNLINWYSLPTGGTSLGTGTTYVTSALTSGTNTTSNYTFYASSTNSCGISLARTPIAVTSNSIYPNVTTGAIYTVAVSIPNGSTPNSSWNPWIYNFADPVPSGGIIVGMELQCDVIDQGWGGTGAGATMRVADQSIGVTILQHASVSHTISTFNPFSNYIYGGSNTFKMYFVGYSGWQGFINNGYLIIKYQVKPSLPITVCQNAAFQLKAYGANSYSWTGGVNDGGTFYPQSTQSYTVTGYNDYGCSNSAVQQLIVVPAPTLAISGPTAICYGASLSKSVTINGAYNTFSWSTGSTANVISITPTISTSYTAAVSNTLTGCSHSLATKVLVNSPPSFSVAATSNSFCPGQTTSLSVNTNSASYGLSFDGVDDYVETNLINITEFGREDFTIEAWIKTTGVGEGIVNYANSNAGWEPGEKCFYLDSIGIPSFVGFGNDYILGNVAVNDGVWHHVAVVWDYTGGQSGVGKMYVDGADHTGLVNYFVLNDNNIGSIKLGKPNYFSGEAPNFFSGLMDDVRIWNTALSATLISSRMNSCLTGYESGLVTSFDFEGAIGNANVTDLSLHDNHGTLVNMNLNAAWQNGRSNCFTTYNSYTWSPGSLSTPSVTVTPLATTVYTVSVTDSHLCTNSITRTITVNPSPTINVNSGAICAGNSFTINTSGANTYTYLNGSSFVTPTTSTSYSIVGTSSLGCLSANPGISNVTVNSLPVLIITGPSAVCSGSTITQTVSGANSYSWNTGSTSNIISVSPIVPTGYTVVGTNTTTGCYTSTTKIINIGNPPVINVSGGNVCAGSTFTLMPNGASSYTFSNGTNTVSATVSPTVNTSYYISGTSSLGCVSTNSAIANVIINPAPNIFVNSAGLCAGETFTMNPTGANTYTFSNGSSTVIPTANSTYTVTGTNVLGCESIVPAIANVTVHPLPFITASNGTVCAGGNYSLMASGANSYTFVTTNGPISTWVSPTVTTTYSVIGTSMLGCVSSNTATIQLNVAPLPTVSVNSSTVCAGSVFTMNPTGATNYTFSSGTSTVVPISNGFYSVIGSNSLGCISASAAVANVTLVAAPTVSVNSGVICAGGVFTMVPSGATTYTFSSLTATVSPLTNSGYTVVGTNSLGCVSINNAISNVVVKPSPTLSVLGNTLVCSGENTTLYATGANTYTWNSTLIGGTQNFAPLNTTAYVVTGENSNSCVNTITVSIVVNPLPLISLNSGTVCPSSTFTIVPTGALSYSYSSGSNIVMPLVTSSYSVTGTDANGCTSIIPAITTVTVINAISISVSGTSVVCAGQPASLMVVGAANYTWSTGANTSTVAPTPSISSTYSVVGANGTCMDTAFVAVNVNPLPVIAINPSSSVICAGESATLTGSGALSYSWSSGETNNTLIVNPAVTSSYTLIGVDGNQCSNKTVFTQSVTECLGIKSKLENTSLIKMYPNPSNGDFTVEVPEELKMLVLNYLGQIVLEENLKLGLNRISLKHAKGIYILQFSNDRELINLRLIKE